MKITTGLLAVSSLAFLAVNMSISYGQTTSDTIAVIGGTLIDGNGGDPIEDSVVIVEGNRILAVGEQGEIDVPDDAITIDAVGKFVLPGLWDAQVSYNWYFGEVMLNYGITSTIDVGNSGEVAIPHRNGVQAGILRGPRPFTGLSRLNRIPDGGTGLETILTPARAPQSTDEAKFLARSFLEAGADALMFNDGAMPMEYYLAGIEVADELGAPVFTRSYGPVYGPWQAVEHSSDNIPHSAGIWAAVTRNPPEPDDPRDWLDMYADMDDERAEALIERLVENGTALTPTFQANFRGYPADWALFESEDRRFFATADPDLLAYYPDARQKAALGFYDGRGPNRIADEDVRARKIAGFKNALRFHKMFVDAGGHLVPGANTNPSRVPGENLHHEIAVFVEAGVTPMQIIQGATQWSAEMLHMGDDLGTVEAGKIADIIVVNADPLADIRNLREIDTVIFNGDRVELGYDPAYEDPFHRSSEMNPPVEALQWVAAFKEVAFNARGFRFTGRRPGGPGTPLPDPVESPQPAVETITPIMVTQGDPTVTITLTGFHFVKRSRVYFEGTSVPYRAISPTELEITIDASLLHEAGWRDLVVVNPPPYNPEIGTPWGNGTSNTAHLIVDYRYD
jgi:hypothetical protein